METKNILVLGAPGSGKTTAMENVCDRLLQTGNLEQGSLIINSRKMHLLSCSGDQNWKYMQRSLFKELQGFIIIDGAIIFIDSTKGITKADEDLIKFVDHECLSCGVPYLILANKQDLKDKKQEISFVDAQTIPTIAKDKNSIRKALKILLESIDPYREFVKDHPYVEVVKIKNCSK